MSTSRPRATAIALVQADVGNLGIGVGAPRDVQGAQLLATEEERVLDDGPPPRNPRPWVNLVAMQMSPAA